MTLFVKLCSLLFFLQITLFGIEVDTFYGPIEVEEPVLIELIASPAFQRLKFIHQYGVSYYTTYKEEYTRYAHSIGVFTVLRLKGCSLEEQIAGLLHDVSHTVFSHVGDWIFGRENEEQDYQNTIHYTFLKESGLEEILNRHGYLIANILPKEEFFPALEQKNPNLSADRIDYNIQGAYYQDFITYEEAQEILKDLSFVEGNWISTKKDLMEKLVRFSLFMTENCWGSAANCLMSRWLADAILRGIETGLITYKDIHFGTDQAIWEKLSNSKDPLIQRKMEMLFQVDKLYSLVNPQEADLIIINKFRGIDPWIKRDEKLTRLTSISPTLSKEYKEIKEKVALGWAIKLH